MDSIDDAESQRLLQLLDKAIHDSRRSRREIERSLGLGQGYLGSLFRGRIELKVWHVYRLARELGLDPLRFFFDVSPPQDSKWVLEALGIDPEEALKKDAPAGPEPVKEDEPLTARQVEQIVMKTLRHELKRRGVRDPDEPGPPGE